MREANKNIERGVWERRRMRSKVKEVGLGRNTRGLEVAGDEKVGKGSSNREKETLIYRLCKVYWGIVNSEVRRLSEHAGFFGKRGERMGVSVDRRSIRDGGTMVRDWARRLKEDCGLVIIEIGRYPKSQELNKARRSRTPDCRVVSVRRKHILGNRHGLVSQTCANTYQSTFCNTSNRKRKVNKIVSSSNAQDIEVTGNVQRQYITSCFGNSVVNTVIPHTPPAHRVPEQTNSTQTLYINRSMSPKQGRLDEKMFGEIVIGAVISTQVKILVASRMRMIQFPTTDKLHLNST
ncbi:hypothetical protein Tco_0780205 [Tanacetum coccineum]